MFWRKRIKHTDADFYQYHYGDVFTNGAQEMAFESVFENPIFSFRGAGRVAGSIMATQPPPFLMPVRVSVVGNPTFAGQLEPTALTDNPLGLGD